MGGKMVRPMVRVLASRDQNVDGLRKPVPVFRVEGIGSTPSEAVKMAAANLDLLLG